METDNKSFFRFPAEKVSIKELEEGQHIEEKEQNPNYILINGNKKIFRINVVATLIHKELRGSATNILIDDATGKMTMRIFEESKVVHNLTIGDIVQVIGKIRVYNQEKYIFPEIIKKINPLWLKVRFLELQKNQLIEATVVVPIQAKIEKKVEVKIKEVIREVPEVKEIKSEPIQLEELQAVTEEIEENDPLLPYEKLSKLINQLDQGQGVMIEEIIEKSPIDKTEELIEKMLENGDIFQNMPGKVKLL